MLSNIMEHLKCLHGGLGELSWILMYPIIEINTVTCVDFHNHILIASLIKKHVLCGDDRQQVS